MTLLKIIPFWIWILLYLTILCNCITFFLFQTKSSYRKESSLKKRIFHVVIISIITSASLLLSIITIAFVAEIFFKNNLLQGIGLMLLLIFFIVSVLFLIQRHKIKHWCTQNSGACKIEFPRKRVPGKVLKYRILSIDKIPIDQFQNAFITCRTIYLSSGKHCIEYSLEETDPWWHGRVHICHEKRRFEKTFMFKTNRLYKCEVTGTNGNLRIVSKCEN